MALSLLISGGAYAAVQAGDGTVPLTESQAKIGAIGVASADAPRGSTDVAGLAVSGETSTITSVTEDKAEAHASTEEQTDQVAQGERKVKTAGVDGVTRTTYQVTTVDGQEVSRVAVSSVVVTPKVDEVVQVGTGSATDVAVASAGDGTSAASAQAIAKALLSSYGWGDDQFSCLVSLWNRESNWNYQAENASSGAYGIPQSLPGSKMASVASDWATNPATQITWGLGYISGRYGSPCNAWAHSESVGWY